MVATLTARATAQRQRAPIWLLVLAALCAAVAVIPLVYLVARAADAGAAAFVETLLRERVGRLTLNTVALTAAVTATCFVIGTLVGAGLARVRLPGGRLWILLAALPLAVPSYLAAFGWLVLTPGLNGFGAAWMVMSAVCVPYVVLPVVAASRSASGDLEAVARTLGRSPFGAFRVATWPQIRPAATAGALLVALYTLSDFGAVSMLRFQTLTWGIKAAYGASFDRLQAALLALVLVLLALLVVVAERRARGHLPGSASRAVQRARERSRWAPALIVLLLASPVLGVLIPLLGMGEQLLSAESIRAVDWPRLMGAVGATLTLAVLGSVAAVGVSIPIAVLAARFRGRIVGAIEAVGYTGHAVPGIVVGLSLVFFSLAVLPGLYQTMSMLVCAYAVLFMSKSIGATRGGLAAVPERLVEVARTLGLTAWEAWWRITMRLAAPAVGVGALLVGLAIMKELPATLLLRPTGISTLAVELWNRTGILEFGSAAPYAAALVVVAALPTYLLVGVRNVAREAS